MLRLRSRGRVRGSFSLTAPLHIVSDGILGFGCYTLTSILRIVNGCNGEKKDMTQGNNIHDRRVVFFFYLFWEQQGDNPEGVPQAEVVSEHTNI